MMQQRIMMNNSICDGKKAILDKHSMNLSVLQGRIFYLKDFCKHWLQHKEESIDAAIKQTTDSVAIGILEAQKRNEIFLLDEIYLEFEKKIRVELKEMLLAHRLELLEMSANTHEYMRD